MLKLLVADGSLDPPAPDRILAEPKPLAVASEAPHIGVFRGNSQTYLLEFWTHAEWMAIPAAERPVDRAWFMGGPGVFGMFRVRSLEPQQEVAAWKAMDQALGWPVA
jgi:hypothetical protein